jgi:hypothetical protein
MEADMADVKAGSRMRSAVCATEVMVIAAPPAAVELTCGGAAMIAMTEEPGGAEIDSAFAEGTLLGKRYVNEAGDLELLCTKPGDGSLAADGVAMGLKEAKALPSSD